jgi:amino acid transporter
VMFLTVGIVIAASLTHFSPALAFSYPPDAFHLGRPFFVGLGAGLIIALYDYAGYYTTAYMAGELRDPGRVLPRSIVGSILGMMVIYLVMNVGVLDLDRIARDGTHMGHGGSAGFNRPDHHHRAGVGLHRPPRRIARAL